MKGAFQLFAVIAAGLAMLGLLAEKGLTIAVVMGVLLVLLSLASFPRIDPSNAMRLAEIFVLGVTLRWIAAAFSYLVLNAYSPGLVAPDEIYYDNASIYFAEYLAGHVPDPYPGSFAGGVIWVSSVCYYVFGFVPMMPRLLNGILGGWTAVLTALIAARLLNHEVARRAGLIAAVTPSLVVWASLNTKDDSTLLGAQVALLAFLMVRERFSTQMLALFGGALLFIAANRPYEIIFVGLSAIAGFAFAQRQRLTRNILVTIGLTVVFAVVTRLTGATDVTRTGDEGTMAAITGLREGYATGAGSAINITIVDATTPTGLALWAPIGLFYFYFAPFPFTGTSAVSLATSPEMIVLYLLLPSAWRGARLVIRNRFRQAMPLLVYVLGSSVGWSLVVTNVGTLFRYRAQVLFIPIIFVAADMIRRKHAREQARASDPLLQRIIVSRAARVAQAAPSPSPVPARTTQPGLRLVPSPAPARR